MKRVARLHIRVTEEEKAALETRRKEMEFGCLSKYILACSLGQSNEKQKNKGLILKVCYELNKVGVNLNQLAKYANSNKHVDIAVLKEIHQIKKALNLILEEIQK